MAARDNLNTRIDGDLKRAEARENEGQEQAKKRHRSPNYPAVGLAEALERTKRFFDVDGKAGAPTETAAKHIGFASAHGAALSVLAALKSFGLLEDKSGRIVPTQRAVELLHLQEQDPRRIRALRDAALAPAIYRALIEQYRDTGLPSDETLRAELVAYRDFNPKSVNDFLKGFRQTLDFAGLSDLSVIESEPEMATEQVQTESRPKLAPQIRPKDAAEFERQVQTTIPGMVERWTLSVHRGVKAELKLFGEVRKEDIRRLRQQIEFLEQSFDEESENQK